MSDLDEWGQMMVMNVLLRYARTQFLDPRKDPVTGELVETININAENDNSKRYSMSGSNNAIDKKSMRRKQDRATSVEALTGFYSDDEEDSTKGTKTKDTKTTEKKKDEASPSKDEKNEEKDQEDKEENKEKEDKEDDKDEEEKKEENVDVVEEIRKPKARGVSDSDHQLLLANSLNLLHSQSSGVIMAVASLHWYLGSRKDITTAKIVKAMCRVFRTARPGKYLYNFNAIYNVVKNN